MRTVQAIELVQRAIKAGIHDNFIKIALVAEEFSQDKADTIMRWCHKLVADDTANGE